MEATPLTFARNIKEHATPCSRHSMDPTLLSNSYSTRNHSEYQTIHPGGLTKLIPRSEAGILDYQSQSPTAMSRVRDKKYGRDVFYIDGDEIKEKRHGKTLYYVDGPEVKQGGKNGKLYRYIDGNEVKDKKHGKVVLYFDGDEVKDKKYGKDVFYINGNEIKTKKYGDTVLFFEERVPRHMLQAVLAVY